MVGGDRFHGLRVRRRTQADTRPGMRGPGRRAASVDRLTPAGIETRARTRRPIAIAFFQDAQDAALASLDAALARTHSRPAADPADETIAAPGSTRSPQ